jgi:UDP-N-acetylmuramyl pentapeptide phosphotransferase/UDP-N-acetylglucosamine-1-phosphate transferase
VNVLLGVIVGVLAVRALVMAGGEIVRSPALQRRNFRDRPVVTAAGVFAIVAIVAVEGGRALLGAFGVGDVPGPTTARLLMLLAVAGFGLLGLLDDLLGTHADQGFRGHLGALAHGRLTTGVVKIFGGGALALVLAGTQGDGSDGGRVLADAALIALGANLTNLFDRAPGRAIKVGIAAWLPLAIAAGTGDVGVALAPVIGAFAGLLGDDLRERMMLGDTGAYALGAALGLGVVLECAPATRTVVLIVLVVLTAAAEVVSFSRVIDRVPPLRALDRVGRRTA